MPTRNSRLLVTKAKHNGGTKAIKGKITRRVQHEYIRPERKKKNEKDYQFKTQYTYYLSNNGHSKGQLITE